MIHHFLLLIFYFLIILFVIDLYLSFIFKKRRNKEGRNIYIYFYIHKLVATNCTISDQAAFS